MRIVKCPHCGAQVEVGSRRSTSERVGPFLAGTKGAFIYNLIKEAGSDGITKEDILRAVFEKYGSDCVGRVNGVLTALRREGQLENVGGRYRLKE